MLSRLWDARTARVLSTILVFVAVLAFLHGARNTLELFLFSLLFAYFLAPLVRYADRFLHGQLKSIALVYVLLFGLLIGLGFLVGPNVAAEGKSLMTSLPGLLDRMASGQLVAQIGHHQGLTERTQQQLQQFFLAHREQILSYTRALAARLAEPATHLWWAFLIPILALLMLKDGTSIATWLEQLPTAPGQRATLSSVLGDINIMLGDYIRAQLILAALTAVVLTAALSLMRVPYAVILGPIAGLFEVIPVVGPALACSIIWTLGLLAGYNHEFWLFFMLGTWRIIQDYINAPRIFGSRLEITPLVEIFAVLAGGEIGGVVGALVAVPVVAILRILRDRLTSEEAAREALTAPIFQDALPDPDTLPSSDAIASSASLATSPASSSNAATLHRP